MKNMVILSILVMLFTESISFADSEEMNYAEKWFAVGKAKGDDAAHRYLLALEPKQLVLYSKQVCDLVQRSTKTQRKRLHHSLVLVQTALLVAHKKAPAEVLKACVKDVKLRSENVLWRSAVLDWLGQVYRKNSTEDEAKQIISILTDIAYFRKEDVAVRCKAIRSLAGLLHGKSNSAYYAQAAFREAIAKDSWNRRAAMKAAVDKGFQNPWEASLVKTGERILAAIADPKEDTEFRFHAVASLRWILKLTYSDKALENARLKLKAILTEESTPTAVAVLAGRELMDLFGDLTILKEIEGRLPEAKEAQARAKDTLEHCETLIRQLKARIKAKKEGKESTE